MKELPAQIRALYPFQPKRFATPHGDISYVDEGQGEVVLLVHGNPTWSFFYRDLITELVASGFRVIAPDHLGCGLSDKPPQRQNNGQGNGSAQAGFSYTLEEHIGNLVALVTEGLGQPRFHLVVHDWGGSIGMGLATRMPSQVGRIQIFNTGAWSAPRMPRRIAICRVPLLGAVLVRGLNAFAIGATRMCSVRPLSPAVRAGFLFPYDSWANRIALHGFVKDIPMTPRHPSWQCLAEIGQELPKLRGHAMQICWGMRDWCFDHRFLKEWQQLFPRAKTIPLPHAAHYLLEDAGPEINLAVREFLTS